MVPDLSGLIYTFLAAYTALLLLQIMVVVAVGYIVGRRRGAWIGLLVGVVSAALIVAAFAYSMWIHYALATVFSIVATVVIARQERPGRRAPRQSNKPRTP